MGHQPLQIYSMRAAFLAQFGGIALIGLLALALGSYASLDPQPVSLMLAMLQGGIAAIIAFRQKAPRWWLFIHLGFAPLVVFVHQLDISPDWFLAGFVLLLLLYWRTDKSRVPLYLTNNATADTLSRLLPSSSCRFIDIGCGNGGLLWRLAKKRPDCDFTGIEHAPLPWLLAWLRCLGLPNAHVHHGDFWHEPLAGYDLVYAFLSPAPMSRLWLKARAELGPDARLVSNSFVIPGVDADETVEVPDRRATRLHLYRPDKARESAAFPPIPDNAYTE